MAQSNISFGTSFTDSAAVDSSPSASKSPPSGARMVLPTVAAYEALLPEMEALGEDELAVVNIDMMAAITTVTGALPEIRALRTEIARHLPSFDLEQFDRLEQYTLALNHAHSRYRKSFAPKEDLTALTDELNEVRDNMMANAASLARMRLIDGEQLKSLKTIPGYKALASDVLTLCTTFTDDWSKVQGKTPFTEEELHRAGTRALDLLNAVGQREQAPTTTGEATLLRQKAYTLFLRAYEQARRAVHYLRNDIGDGEGIAPSLYLNRARRQAGQVEVDVDVEAAGGSSAAAASVTPTPPGAAPASPAIVVNNPAGFPIVGGPFNNN